MRQARRRRKPGAGPDRVRRSSHLISYWRDSSIITRNFATGHAVIGDPLVSYILTMCGDWISPAEIYSRVPEVSRRTLTDVLATMVEQRLLIQKNAPADAREAAMSSWQEWNPAAGFFHFSTKNMPAPASLETAERNLRERFQASGSPPAVKRYPRAPMIKLTEPAVHGEFSEVLRRRRTWRSFEDSPVSIQQISTLLRLTWGVQHIVESEGMPAVHLKTSPSSGARQPLEAYMLAVNVDGLAPGLYHYVADRHCLERLKRGASRNAIARYVPAQPWYQSAAALFMMTAVFARTQWRYGFPRAYRSVLLEAGHVCQTFCLVATWLGLAPFCTGRFADAEVEQDVGSDGITESFIYGAGVGQSRADREGAPWLVGENLNSQEPE